MDERAKASCHELQGTESPSPTPSDETGAGEMADGSVVNNRYHVIRKLGSGGMGSVHLVSDSWRGDCLLALKRVRKDRTDPRTISILRNEFLALSPLSHPHLARVYDFEMDLRTQDYFFTSEYVEGVQLLRAARDFRVGRQGDFLRLLEVLAQVLRALEFIHSRGLVHGDIKPENILVTGGLNERRSARQEPPLLAKMIDFGLTKREKEFGGKRIVGTAYYIAPETLLGSQIDRRADLYSLGVLLYHLSTRRLPFTGENNLAVLRGHIERVPAPPTLVEPSVPEALSQMILKLMEKQPGNRYGSAMELLAELNRVFSTDFPLETPDTRVSYVKSGGFVGREADMAELTSLFESVYQVERAGDADDELSFLPGMAPVMSDRGPPPAGRCVVIRGEPGVGKRRLLKEFRRYVQTRGIHYIEIDCSRTEEGGRRAFAELVHAQVGIVSARSPEEAPDRARLQAFIDHVEKVRASPLTLRPAIDKLAQKFLTMSQVTPFVLAFIEISKADTVLLEFVRALVSRVAGDKGAESRVMVVATAEDSGPDESVLRPFYAAGNLRAFIRELRLERFSPEEVGSQLTTMFGTEGSERRDFPPDFLVQLVHEESDGNPGVVQEIVEFLVAQDRIRRMVSGWHCEPVERESIPGKVRMELRGRIQGLDTVARKLAIALALIDRGGGELEVAARLAEIPPSRIIDAVLGLERLRIIREEPGDSRSARYSFVHSSAREILYEVIPVTSRPGLHDRAGRILEAHLVESGKKDPRRLAFHFLRAGNAEAALRYGMDAAREYVALHQPRKAVEVYAEMLPFARERDHVMARRVEHSMANLHAYMGEYRRAADLLGSLAGWKQPSPPQGVKEQQRAAAFTDLGDVLCKLGDFREAAACYGDAFRVLKGGGATLDLAKLLLGYADLYARTGKCSESLRYCDRLLSWEKGLQRVDLEARLHLLLGENHYRLDNKEIAAKYCQKGLEILGSLRSVDDVALTLQCLGKFYTYRGRFQKALKNLEQCAVVNQKTGALDRRAECLRDIAAIHLTQENPREALAQLNQAITLFERTENLTGWAEALNLRAEALRFLGRYEEAQRDVREALQKNSGIGSIWNATESCLTSARIATDQGHHKRAEAALAEAERCREAQTEEREPLAMLVLRLQVETRRGNFAEALDLGARATIVGREVGNRLRTVPLLEAMARLHLTLVRPSEARRNAAALGEIGIRYGLRVVEARAEFLQGMVFAVEGKAEEAAASFEKALAVFREERSERDLLEVYIEYGRRQLASRNLEQAYILLEEGLYLAKKLNLAHAKCRLFHLMGLLESAMPESVFNKAVGHFLSAERFAQGLPVPDLLWRVRRDLGRLYLDAARLSQADKALTSALAAREEVLAKVPEAFRESYMTEAGQEDLAALQKDVHLRAETQSRREVARYPVRDPDKDDYFGVVGRSEVMKELKRALAALSADVPWVWIWGAPGSGRRRAAAAVHEQSLPERGKSWTVAAPTLKPAILEKLLREVEEARSAPPSPAGRPPAGTTAAAATPARPARLTLIVTDLPRAAREVQLALLERILMDRDRHDGLRVVAILDGAPESFASMPAAEGGSLHVRLLEERFPALHVPDLAERKGDVPLLVDHFLQAERRSEQDPRPHLDEEALQTLLKQPFPGQVRELRQFCDKIRRLAGPGGLIGPVAVRTALNPTLKSARRK